MQQIDINTLILLSYCKELSEKLEEGALPFYECESDWDASQYLIYDECRYEEFGAGKIYDIVKELEILPERFAILSYYECVGVKFKLYHFEDTDTFLIRYDLGNDKMLSIDEDGWTFIDDDIL